MGTAKNERDRSTGMAHPGHGAKSPAMAGMQHAASTVHIMHMVGELDVMANEMIIHSLFVALALAPKENLQELQQARDQFNRVAAALRAGDDALALPATTDENILRKLDEVDRAWADFEPGIASILRSGAVSSEQVTFISRSSRRLLAAVAATVDAYEYYAFGGRAFSALTGTVKVAEQQQGLLKKMIVEYLLIAYGYRPETNRLRLDGSQQTFDRVLKGLSQGDSEIRVLPPPSSAIEKQYRVVQQMWQDLRPRLNTSGNVAGRASSEEVQDVAFRGLYLADAMSEVVRMYHEL